MSDVIGKPMSTKYDMVGGTKYSTVGDAPPNRNGTLPSAMCPEALMAWLYTQMRNSNHEVQKTLHDVDTGRARLGQLQKLQQMLRNMKDACRSDGDTSKVAMQDAKGCEVFDNFKDGKTGAINKDALEKTDWYQALSPDGKAEVQAFLEKWNRGEGKDNKVMESQVDTLLDAVKDEISSINSDNELQMINLQHVMQTRNQAIQLCSNIISVMDKAAETPIGAIGRI
jgi:hypothetical protein